MKTLRTTKLAAACWLAVVVSWNALADDDIKPAAAAASTESKSEAAAPSASKPETPVEPKRNAAAKAPLPPLGEDQLRLNFRGVPVDMVLDYLSEAAGFIIIKETEVRGKVDVWSNQTVTKEEAVDLLNTILNKNDYAAIRNGRTLTIVARDEAKKRDIPVKKGGDSDDIPKTDDMVTQVIPVKHANVSSLMNNLRPLIGTYAEITVNESANTLVVTATQRDIKRMIAVINALDESIADNSAIKVVPLKYADSKEIATIIKELFASNQQNTGNRGAGGGGFQGGGFQGGNLPAALLRNAFQGGGFGGGGGGGGGGGQQP